MGAYCVVNGGKWQCVPTKCHTLAIAQIPWFQSVYPDATFIRTSDCRACGGGGCSTGLSELLCNMLPGLIRKEKEIKLIEQAVRRLGPRRRGRRVRPGLSLADAPVAVSIAGHPSGECVRGTLTIAGEAGRPDYVTGFCLSPSDMGNIPPIYRVTTLGFCQCTPRARL
jgi:hypothetical protein